MGYKKPDCAECRLWDAQRERCALDDAKDLVRGELDADDAAAVEHAMKGIAAALSRMTGKTVVGMVIPKPENDGPADADAKASQAPGWDRRN